MEFEPLYQYYYETDLFFDCRSYYSKPEERKFIESKLILKDKKILIFHVDRNSTKKFHYEMKENEVLLVSPSMKNILIDKIFIHDPTMRTLSVITKTDHDCLQKCLTDCVDCSKCYKKITIENFNPEWKIIYQPIPPIYFTVNDELFEPNYDLKNVRFIFNEYGFVEVH